MARGTENLSIDNTKYYNIPVDIGCKTITIYEQDQAGTNDYFVLGGVVGANTNPVKRPAGAKTEIKHPFTNFVTTDVPAQIKTAAGSFVLHIEYD